MNWLPKKTGLILFPPSLIVNNSTLRTFNEKVQIRLTQEVTRIVYREYRYNIYSCTVIGGSSVLIMRSLGLKFESRQTEFYKVIVRT